MKPINPFNELQRESAEFSSINILGNNNVLVAGNQNNTTINQNIAQYIVPVEKEKSASDWYLEGINHLNKKSGLDLGKESVCVEEAEACFNAAIHVNKNCTEAWVARGFLRTIKHQYKPAIFDYQTALDLDPENCIIIYNLALALIKDKEIEEALGHLERARELGCAKKNKDINPLIEVILKMECK